jgi:rSAM/selenodomain-associated transferase 2
VKTGANIIVVDGGSTDDTVSIATTSGGRVLTAPRGRGNQIAAGVAAAGTQWLLVLHADTQPQPGWHDAVAAHMARGPGHAGYFRFALDSLDPRARRLERIVAWRARVLGLPYGDQGLLIHRDLLRQVGGVRRIPLMEDVDLIRRIGRSRLRALPASALTSAERWERDGYLRRSARNLLCLSLWFAGVPPRRILRLYQ